MREVKVSLVGYGIVGHGVVDALSRKKAMLRDMGLKLKRVSVTDHTGTVLAENAISNLVFPEGATSVEFDLSIAIRSAATEPPTPMEESLVSARMRMTLSSVVMECNSTRSATAVDAPTSRSGAAPRFRMPRR